MGAFLGLLPYVMIFLLGGEIFSRCVDCYPNCLGFLGRVTKIESSGNPKDTKSGGIPPSARGKHCGSIQARKGSSHPSHPKAASTGVGRISCTATVPFGSGSMSLSHSGFSLHLLFLNRGGLTGTWWGEKFPIRECSWVVICSFTVLSG